MMTTTTDELEIYDLATRKGIDSFLEYTFKQWCPELMARQGEIFPIAVIFGKVSPTGERLDRVVPTFIQPVFDQFDGRTKDAVALAIRKQARVQEAVGVIFISEVWTSRAANRDNGKGAPPADRLDRTESVMVSVEHVTYETPRIFLMPILRTGKKRRPTLGPPTQGEQSPVPGRFMDLMERRSTS